MSLVTDLLKQQRSDARTVADIKHKNRKPYKGRKLDPYHDPVFQKVMRLAGEGGFSTRGIAEALGISEGMVQLRLSRAKMVSTAGLGMSRKDYRDGTSLLARRKIQELTRNTMLDPLYFKHLNQHVKERDEKIKKRS